MKKNKIEFVVDHVFVKISPTKSMMRFTKKNIAYRFIVLFEIFIIGYVAYGDIFKYSLCLPCFGATRYIFFNLAHILSLAFVDLEISLFLGIFKSW